MKKYYIEIKNGRPFGQKMDDIFLRKRFPEHNFDIGLPSNIVEYVCSEKPEISKFQKIDINLLYVDNKIVENFEVRDMTADEKQIAVAIKKRNFILNTGYKSWKYDEETDQFYAPITVQNPTNNGVYSWNEENLEWELLANNGEDL